MSAIEWLYAHRDGIRLEPDVTLEISILERFKPVGELAVICKVLAREGVAGSRQADLARRLLDQAWRQVLERGRALVRGQRIEPRSPNSGYRLYLTATPRSGPLIYFPMRWSMAEEASAYAAAVAESMGVVCFDVQQDRLRP